MTPKQRKARVLELVQDKENNYSIGQIADKVGLSPNSVRRILREARRAKIIELAQDDKKDYSAKEIADEEGVTINTVYQTLKKEGATLKNSRSKKAIERTRVEEKKKEVTLEKLTLQQKVNAIKVRLSKKTFAEIATILNCEEKDIEEYLTSINLTEQTLKLLYKKQESAERISEITGIPVNLIESWRMFISKEKQKQKVDRNAEISETAKKSVKSNGTNLRRKFLKTIKVDVDVNREQRLDDLSKRLAQEELSDEDIEDIKRKVVELKMRPSLLVNRAGRKINLTIEQACLLTSNGERLGIMKQEIIRLIVSTYIQHKNIGKAQRYLEEFSTELDLQTRNELIKDIRTAKQGMEH